MTENDKLQMFEDQAIRTAWDEETEEWYFSIVDVVHDRQDCKLPDSESSCQAAAPAFRCRNAAHPPAR